MSYMKVVLVDGNGGYSDFFYDVDFLWLRLIPARATMCADLQLKPSKRNRNFKRHTLSVKYRVSKKQWLLVLRGLISISGIVLTLTCKIFHALWNIAEPRKIEHSQDSQCR